MSDCGSRDRVSRVISSWFYDESKHNFVIEFREHGQRNGYMLNRHADHVTQEKVEQLVGLLKELDPNGYATVACNRILESERPQPELEPLDGLGFPPFKQAAKRVLYEWNVPFMTARLFADKDLYRMLMNFLDALDEFDRTVVETRNTGSSVATNKQWLQCYGLLYRILRAVQYELIERRVDIMRLRDFDPADACYWDDEGDLE